MSVMFCEPCLAMLRKIKWESPWVQGRHHKTFADLCDAANDRCYICKRLRRRFIERGITVSETLLSREIKFLLSNPYDSDRVVIYFSAYASDASGHASIVVDLELVAVPPSEGELKGNTAVNTGSDASMSLAAQWLETCITRHTTCSRPRPLELDDWKPSRLLYLGNEFSHELRLCQARDIPNQVRYATLSHCWGTDPERQSLSKRNIVSWSNSIPEAEMMQTFKDAIEVTRRLGTQYLWIDSLCIIQDSITDWLRESSLMSNVYKYSLCNLAASAAADDHGGFFFDRDPIFDLPTRVNLDNIGIDLRDMTPGSDQSEGRGQRSRDGLYDLYWADQWIGDLSHSPLSQRAWVLQERVLSPRTLQFARTQLYWECNEVAACEAYPNGLSVENASYHQARKAPTPFNLLQEISKRSEEAVAPSDLVPVDLREKSYNLWTKIVRDYTKAILTRESDKLIAISAIAREVQPLMQSRYLAGLWESDLIQELGWSGFVGGKTRKSSIYCAPSWSWASTTSCVNMPDHRERRYYRPLIEITNAHVELDGGDEFGPVRAGYLDIFGQLFPSKLRTDGNPNPDLELDGDGYAIPKEFATDMLEGPLYSMPLYLEFSRRERSLAFRTLVLQQCDLPNVYRRVGLVENNIYPYPTTGNACPELLGKLDWPEDTDPVFTRKTSGITKLRLV